MKKSLCILVMLSTTARAENLSLGHLQAAALHGNAETQNNLDVLHRSGEGVVQNLQTTKENFRKSCDNKLQTGCDKDRITHTR